MKYPPAPLTPFLAALLCIRRRAHIPSEQREPKDLNQLSASTTTACSLFALSLLRFRPSACLFSTAYSLFCKNTRGGGIPDGSAGHQQFASTSFPGFASASSCFQRLANPSFGLIDKYAPPFHTVTNPFSRNPFLFTSIQNTQGMACAGLLEDAGGVASAHQPELRGKGQEKASGSNGEPELQGFRITAGAR